MKLDRNLNADGHGKYGLIKNRRLAAIRAEAPPQYVSAIDAALKALELAGLIDWGDTVDTEFFVIRLRDRFSRPALSAYVAAAAPVDREYAEDVAKLADRAIYHPSKKAPD